MLKASDVTSDSVDFYTKAIKIFDFVATDLDEDRLSDREVTFLICCLFCFSMGERYIFSQQCFDIFSKTGGFNSLQEVRLYSNKKRVKRWLRREKKNYKLPVFCENLITSEKVVLEFALFKNIYSNDAIR